MRSMARFGSLTPGSWMRIRSSPSGMISGSVTPNWSTRLRIVSRLWSTIVFLMSAIRFSRNLRTTFSRPSMTLSGFHLQVGELIQEQFFQVRPGFFPRQLNGDGVVGLALHAAEADALLHECLP